MISQELLTRVMAYSTSYNMFNRSDKVILYLKPESFNWWRQYKIMTLKFSRTQKEINGSLWNMGST